MGGRRYSCLTLTECRDRLAEETGVRVDPWTVGRALQCDFQGRAIDTGTGLQLAGPAELVLTHVGVVSGAFQPPTRYVLSINPVWSVRIQKQIRDVSNNWVDQLGG